MNRMEDSPIKQSTREDYAEAEEILEQIAEKDSFNDTWRLTLQRFGDWYIGMKSTERSESKDSGETSRSNSNSSSKRPFDALEIESHQTPKKKPKAVKMNDKNESKSKVAKVSEKVVTVATAGSIEKPSHHDVLMDFMQPHLTAPKRNAILKSVVSTLKSSIKKKKWYENGGLEECSAEAVMSEDEFDAIFGKIGKLVIVGVKAAVTTQNDDGTVTVVSKEKKPSKTITNKELSEADVDRVFGKLIVNITVPTFSEPHNFRKQYKTGTNCVVIGSATLSYSKNSQSCKFKFWCDNTGPVQNAEKQVMGMEKLFGLF